MCSKQYMCYAFYILHSEKNVTKLEVSVWEIITEHTNHGRVMGQWQNMCLAGKSSHVHSLAFPVKILEWKMTKSLQPYQMLWRAVAVAIWHFTTCDEGQDPHLILQ